MRQVVDVIHRIQWDDDLPTERFAIGYLDRFVGIIEKPFAAFSWEDLASVDSRTVLAVPKHRFQYIKYEQEIVWDKRVQLDNFFGSRGDGTTIADVLARRAAAATAKAAAAPATAAAASQPTMTFEDDLDDADDNASAVSHRPGPPRPNFFVGIRVTAPDVVAAAESVQQSVVAGDPRLADGVLPPTSLHVTVCMLRVATGRDSERVRAVLAANRAHFAALFADSELRLDGGVGEFRGRVVYARVRLTPELSRLNLVLLQAFREAGVATPGNHEAFEPHMTLVKLSRPMCRAMGAGAAVEPALYAPFAALDFGAQRVEALHVCSMTEPKAADGFYVRMTSLELGVDVLAATSLVPCLSARVLALRDGGALSAGEATALTAALSGADDTRRRAAVQRLLDVADDGGGHGADGWRFFPTATTTTTSDSLTSGCVYVLRGLPGSGKSRLAETLRSRLGASGTVKICSADEYFVTSSGGGGGDAGGERDIDTGASGGGAAGQTRYDFSTVRVREAHAFCLDQFLEALNAGTRHLIVDNTHVQRWQYGLYRRLATLGGYRVRVVQLACADAETTRRFVERCQHAVPLPAALRMKELWEEDASATVVQPVWRPGDAPSIDDVITDGASPGAAQQQASSIYYAAVFLSQKSRRNLLRVYPVAHPENVPADLHCTLLFKPALDQATALPLGSKVTLRVMGCADDGRNQAVAVRLPSGVTSENAQPHITISYANGSHPKFSNDVLAAWAASGRALDRARDLVVEGTVGCMTTRPPFDDLAIVTDADRLRRNVAGDLPSSAAPAIVSESPSERDAVDTLYIYDFDGTLVDTVGPTFGPDLYRQLTGGDAWPHQGWLGHPDSLRPPVPLRPGPSMRSFRQHRRRPHTRLVVLTGRQAETMHVPVVEVLRAFDALPERLICQPWESPDTALYKEQAMETLIGALPQLRKLVFYDDLAENLAACERLGKRYPHLECGVVDAASHEAPAKQHKDPLYQFVKTYGSLASGSFRLAVAAVLELLTDAWANVVADVSGVVAAVAEEQAQRRRLVIPFGSVVLGRCSDLDVCCVAPAAVPADHMQLMQALADQLERCGVARVHRGFSKRCPRLRCVVTLSSHAPLELDVVFARLPAAAFDRLVLNAGDGDNATIGELFSAIPKSDPVSQIALGGPLFAEDVLQVVAGADKCSPKTFAAVVEAVVLLLRARNLKSNAFHYPRTFHVVKLLAQFLAAASPEQTSSATKLFGLFVRQAHAMGAGKWSRLCREFVPDAYFPLITEVMGSAYAVVKRPQDITVDTFADAFRLEPPHVALLSDGFTARLVIPAASDEAASGTSVPSADLVWKAGVLLDARLGTYARDLLTRGFLFQPDCRPSCSHLLPEDDDVVDDGGGDDDDARRRSCDDVVLLEFAVRCSNVALDARATLRSALSPMLAEISAVFPDARCKVVLRFDS